MIILTLSFVVQGQGLFSSELSDEMKAKEEELYASTKQLNQFFRRFNGEEDYKGNRYYEGDKDYRDESLRKKYLPNLFDQSNSGFDERQVKDFVKEAIKEPVYLDLHQEGWFAEVMAVFIYKGRETGAQLFMQFQPQGKGYEWVIRDIAFGPYLDAFDKDTSDNKPFLHPMSHELEFMNLRKAFENEDPESYTLDDYEPDFLTLFLYDLKQGNLDFKTIKSVKYHFFGLDGWYFEVSRFNRSGMNSGWLISNLVAVDERQKDQLRRYIYGK
jgi:hypothetical protein